MLITDADSSFKQNMKYTIAMVCKQGQWNYRIPHFYSIWYFTRQQILCK